MFWQRLNQINEQKWEQYINRPNWYLKLLPDYKYLLKRARKDQVLFARVKEQAYSFFEKHLDKDDLYLADSGPAWDKERQKIDTVVIHHTANPSGMSHKRLSAMHLLRLYASFYIYPSKKEKKLRGRPIWSGHFNKEGKQVFYSYHWLVRSDGGSYAIVGISQSGYNGIVSH